MPYITFAKPIDVNQEVVKISQRIQDANRDRTILVVLALKLKTFQGKPITKRLETFLNNLGPVYSYRIERIASLVNLNVYKEGIKIVQVFLAYQDKNVYDETFLLDHNNFKAQGLYLEKLQNGLAKIPEFVTRYNDLLEKGKALVEDAKQVELEYEFDILSRENK
jgi:hypothetical protein